VNLDFHIVEDRVGERIMELFRAPTSDGGIVGVFNDVTERRKTEAALQESEMLFKAVVNHSPTKIHLKDASGHCTLINKEAAKLYGVTGDENLGKTSTDLFTKDEYVAFQAHDKRVFETGQASEEEEKKLTLMAKFTLISRPNSRFSIRME